MKKIFRIIISIFSCFMAYALNTMVVSAATVEEIKERWYDTRYYPLYEGNEEWQKHNMFDTLDILNPPLDLLLNMPTEELSDLMQEYPLMPQITTYYAEDGSPAYDTFYSFIELNSDIFYELLRREDGITCLLKEYQANELDIELMNTEDHSSYEEYARSNKMWLKEVFGCHFIHYYAHHFTESEYELACQIIEEKQEIYPQLRESLRYYLDLPKIEPPNREDVSDTRTNYLKTEEIQEKEEKIATAILQMKSEENPQPDISYTADSADISVSTNSSETDEKASNQKMILVVEVAFGTVCIIGGTLLILRRRR